MHVIILYQHRVRELQACEQLAAELRSRGIGAEVFNIDFELGVAARDARRHGCDAVFTPWCYHADNYLLMYPFVQVNPDVLVINLHQEQIASQVSRRVLMPKGPDAKSSVLHYVWGERFAEHLREVGVPEELISVTGNMRNDFEADALLSKQALAEQFGLDPDKRWLLIAESRGWVLSYTPVFRSDLLHQGYTEQETDEYYDANRESLELTVAELNELPADFLPDWEIIYRPHPGTLADAFTNPRIRVISEHGIHHWLANIDLIAVWNSTTVYEAEMHGVPGVVWETLPNPEKFKAAGLEHFPTIRHLTELERFWASDPQPTQYYVELFGPNDKQSVRRIADALERDLAERPRGYRARVVPRTKHYLRHQVFEKLSEASVRLGLLERIKWPRSAYGHRTDLPSYGKRR